MAQRGMQPLRLMVPTTSAQRLSKGFSPSLTPTPSATPVIHQRPNSGSLWVSILLHLMSLYTAHQWFIRSPHASPTIFAFLSFSGAGILLAFLQRPWKGREISGTQWVIVIASGILSVFAFVLRLQGLRTVGPLATILAEYAGALVGKVLRQSQRRVHGIGKAKIRGAIAVFLSLLLLSKGWTLARCSPLSALLILARSRSSRTKAYRSSTSIDLSISDLYGSGEERALVWNECRKYLWITIPILAGLVSSLQKVLPARSSLKFLPKKRLQALTFMTAWAAISPLGLLQIAFQKDSGGLDRLILWPLCTTIIFGLVISFYGDFYSEDRLQISPHSSFHFLVTMCCVCILELLYGLDFSLVGFLMCSVLLGVGVRDAGFITGNLGWAPGVDKGYPGIHPSFDSLVKSPWHYVMTDSKSRKIAMFLLMNTGFMIVEFVFGFLSNSLGLISDACHMLFDCAALAIGLYASYISGLPANSKFPYGYGRFEVISGFANGIFLILVASLIVLESLERILEPPEISTESILIVSVGGLLVNILGLIFFHEAHHHAHSRGPCMHIHAHEHSQKFISPISSFKDNPSSSIQCPDKSLHGSFNSHFQSHGLDSPILSLRDQSCGKHCTTDVCVETAAVPSNELNGKAGALHLDACEADKSFSGFHQHSDENPLQEGSDFHDHNYLHNEAALHRKSVLQGQLLNLDESEREVGVQSQSHLYGKDAMHTHSFSENSDQHCHDHSSTMAQGHKGSEVCHGNHHHHGDGHHHCNSSTDHADQDYSHHDHHQQESKRKLGSEHQEYEKSIPDSSMKSHEHVGNHHGFHNHNHGPHHDHSHHQGHGHHIEDYNDHSHHHVHKDHDNDHDHHHIDYNMEGIFLHILADTLGSVGVVISTLLIRYKGWLWTDPACSIFISALIISSVVPLVRNSGQILLQRVPRSVQKAIQKALKKVEQVDGVHDWHMLHVWSYTNTELVGTLRIHAAIGADKQHVRNEVTHILQGVGIRDLAIEVEDVEHVAD